MSAETPLATAWPDRLQVNAWTSDGPLLGEVGDDLLRWAFRPQGEAISTLLRPERPAELFEWRDPDVGWGLLLPFAPALSNAEQACAEDAPEPIRRLLAERPGSPVLRYQRQSRFTHLLRPTPVGAAEPVPLSGAPAGTGPGALPRYLLIYGTPEEVPWELQYLLNQSAAVGRLTLRGEALERYVEALLSDWAGASARPEATVVWAVAPAGDEMLSVLRGVVAKPVHDALAADDDLRAGAAFVDGAAEPATTTRLTERLAAAAPGRVVTTSHGLMAALDDPPAARRTLGLPVGQEGAALEPAELLDAWQPGGAVWYAHACCSAGTDDGAAFRGVLPEGSPVDKVLQSLAAVGPVTAPLPEALLGAEKPLRAFVGHVQPTFDWTVRHPVTRQPLTTSLRQALYDRLFQPWPVGHALEPCYRHAGELFAARDQAYRVFNHGEDTRGVALACQLAALDRQSMVILGDPTATPPPLRG